MACVFSSVPAWADIGQLLAEGDQKLSLGDAAAAEDLYSRALKEDPENYRILRSLAHAQARLEKYEEAESLLNKILGMEVTTQRKVMVELEGETEPLEAEIVDENVVLKEDVKNNMRNYIDPPSEDPVSHYRLFFFKTGKMEMVPHKRAKIRYLGVPHSVHEQVREEYNEVKMKLIGKKGAGASAEMAMLAGGCFTMGNNQGPSIEQPEHEVCLAPFKMDKTEVTQGAFQAAMGTNPSRFKGADLPVEMVTYLEAKGYCEKSGKRLPTEAEWEYAARGGTRTLYYWGNEVDPSRGNFCDQNCDLNIRAAGSDGFKHTAPVRSFPPNPFGLYDMAGNVSEWVSDWFDERYYFMSPRENPQGPQRADELTMRGGTNYKVLRGGAWETDGRSLQSAWRKGLWVDYRIEGLGFRCAARP
ncbi:MAG: hypothetical protein COV67_00545 [Nitrospinae bacterium CG11_big_fil_rev_8_21_14_0_20_56_8]|nr:MAG: hypothetical protein COV67_00545 [Nitrospinae bacterium CG11_big_fil_rev_8_21_14_0_20_56_8]